MSQNKKVIVLHFQKESDQSATLRTLEKAYEKHANTDVIVCSSGSEAAQIMRQYRGGLLLFSVFDRNCVTQLLLFINTCSKELRDGTIKMAGYNNLKNKKVEKYLQKNQCAEQFFGKLTTKTLGYKINLWFKAIDFSCQKVDEQRKREEESKATEIRYCPQMDLASDCWLLESKDQVHNAMKQWFIYMRGPSPCAGSWEEIQNKDDHYDKYWQWVPKMEDQFPFITDLGSWIFKGPQPKFSWKDNTWHFTGRDIYLGFQMEDEDKIHYRFLANNKGALLSENSDAAKFKRDMIEESCNPEYHVDSEDFYEGKDKSFQDEENYDDRVDEIERDDNRVNGHLKGDQSQSNGLSTHYKGRSKYSANELAESEREENQELDLAGHLKDIQKNLNPSNVIDNKLRGQSQKGVELDLEKDKSNSFDEMGNGEPNFEREKSNFKGLILEPGKKGSSTEKGEEYSPEEQLAKKVQLDLEKGKADRAEEDDREQDKINTNMVGKGLASRGLALDKGDNSKDEEESPLEESERKKLREALGLPIKKENENGPHEGQVDHLQKYYGIQKEMGLTDSLSPDIEKRNPEESDTPEREKLSPQERLKRELALNQGLEQYGSEQGGRGNGAPKFDRDPSNREGVPGVDPSGLKTNESGVDHQDSNMLGRGLKDVTKDGDFDGEGSRADYIEKYYGTKKHQQEEDDPKKKRERKSKDIQAGPHAAPQAKEKVPFKGKAKEFDLFGGEKVNLTDIKLSVELIRKGKESNIFDDKEIANLNDLFEDYLVLRSPSSRSISTNEKVMIKVDCSYLGRNYFYDFSGMVEEIEDEEFLDDENQDSFSNVTVKLTSFKEEDLLNITRMFMERQANILKFFKAAKGVE